MRWIGQLLRLASFVVVLVAALASNSVASLAEPGLSNVVGIHYAYHSGLVKYCRIFEIDIDIAGAMRYSGACDRPRAGDFAGQLTEMERSTFFAIGTGLDWNHPASSRRLMDSTTYDLRIRYLGDTRSVSLENPDGDFQHLMRLLDEIVNDDARWTKTNP